MAQIIRGASYIGTGAPLVLHSFGLLQAHHLLELEKRALLFNLLVAHLSSLDVVLQEINLLLDGVKTQFLSLVFHLKQKYGFAAGAAEDSLDVLPKELHLLFLFMLGQRPEVLFNMGLQRLGLNLLI